MKWQVTHTDYSDYGDTIDVLAKFEADTLEAAKAECRRRGIILNNPPSCVRLEPIDRHAFLTAYPDHVEFRLANGYGSEPRDGLHRLMHLLLVNQIETVEIRYENVDD